MENTQRITVASRRLRRTCTVLIFLLPFISALFWSFFNKLFDPASSIPTSMVPLPVPVTQNLPGLIRLGAFVTEMIPLAAMIYGLVKLRELFGLYEQGLIFTEKNVACFRSLGRTLIIWVICDVVKNSLLSIVLTLPNPPGHRMITVGLYSADFTATFVGIVILIIAWVMDEARKIQEDQALII